ncbi:MAG: hypothetical protein A2882_01335 [Phenylobacterium sp. RIFCSPHIGHO2_01_FULL_70_10]|nr:MAG: hypothetical protein A2882_01335 [Phenylobacterium sp. RIFCSPHIGHO2_01_FULL_70_10]
MCEPVSIISGVSAGLGIASSVANYSQGKKNAKAQRAAAIAEYEANMRGLNTRGLQELEAAAQTRLQQQREYRAARAQAIVAAEDAGVMGISADALLNDLALQQNERDDATRTNIDWVLQQLREEQQGSANVMQSRYNAARNPSLGSLLISVGGQAIGAYDKYKTRTDPNWSK